MKVIALMLMYSFIKKKIVLTIKLNVILLEQPVNMAYSLQQSNLTPNECKKYDLSKYSLPGKVLIFNQNGFDFSRDLTRVGSDYDAKNLKETFGDLKFDVESKTDCTVQEIKKKIDYYAEHEKFTDFGCLVIVILTHGSKNGILFAKDSQYHISDIWLPLLSSDALQAKPKILFIQACRTNDGNVVEKRTSIIQHDAGTSQSLSILPHEKHFFIAFSTVEGLLSYRNETNGTWYIQSLCENLRKFPGGQNDLMSLMTRVNKTVGEMDITENTSGQTPVFVSYLEYKIIMSSGHPTFARYPSLQADGILRSDDIGNSQSNKRTSRVVSDAGVGIIANEEPIEQYNITSQNPGDALIFYDSAHETYASKLSDSLENLQFSVRYYGIFNKDLKKKLGELSQDVKSNASSIIIAILAGLGEEKFLDINTLLRECSEHFLASKCQVLSGKPKLFLFLDAVNGAQELSSDAPKQREMQMSNDHANFLQFYGYGPETVNTLLLELSQLQHCKDNILNVVTRTVKKSRRTIRGYLSYFESTLFKDLLLGGCDFQSNEDKNATITNNLSKAAESAENDSSAENKALIAAALLIEGKSGCAKTSFQDALNILGNSQSSAVLDIVRTMSWVLGTLKYTDREVLELYDILIETRSSILGIEHSDTLLLMNNKASALAKFTKYSDVLDLYEKILNTNKDKDDALMIMIMSNKAAILSKLKRQQEALIQYYDVIERKKLKFGIDHEETLLSMHSKAIVLGKMKLYKDEFKILDDIFKIQQTKLGMKHPDTIKTMTCKLIVCIRLGPRYNVAAKELHNSILKNSK